MNHTYQHVMSRRKQYCFSCERRKFNHVRLNSFLERVPANRGPLFSLFLCLSVSLSFFLSLSIYLSIHLSISYSLQHWVSWWHAIVFWLVCRLSKSNRHPNTEWPLGEQPSLVRARRVIVFGSIAIFPLGLIHKHIHGFGI